MSYPSQLPALGERETPTVEEELMLLLCGTAERRRVYQSRIEELARQVDFGAFTYLLAQERLLLVLGPRLVTAMPATLAPEFHQRLEARLEAAKAANAMHSMHLEMVTLQLQGELEAAGIPALSLKGPVLSRALYGDPGARLSTDVDILVSSRRLRDAEEVVKQHGYVTIKTRQGGTTADADGLPLIHSVLVHPDGELAPVELHWRIHWYERQFSERMLQRTVGRGVDRRAQREDELAALVLFFSRDGLSGLRRAADVSAWWDAHGAGVDTGVLDEIVDEYPALRRALVAGLRMLDRAVGLPGGSLMPTALRKSDWRCTFAGRLSNWPRAAERGQVNANHTLIDGLLSPPHASRPGFVSRRLVPPGEVIATMYGLPSRPGWRVGLWRFMHALRVLTRYGLGLWAVRGGRSWAPLPESVRDAAANGAPDR